MTTVGTLEYSCSRSAGRARSSGRTDRDRSRKAGRTDLIVAGAESDNSAASIDKINVTSRASRTQRITGQATQDNIFPEIIAVLIGRKQARGRGGRNPT